ncbi:MAG: hypothetical protein PVF58_15185 [Candidatus Methanofastidiosia archaeon]|jgi:hypothetical protein
MLNKRLRQIKEELNYTDIPQEEKLLTWFKFSKKDYPELDPWVITSNTVNYRPSWVHRNIVLHSGVQMLTIDIFVAQYRSTDVYEALFESYLDYEHVYTRTTGTDYDIDVGDFCLVSESFGLDTREIFDIDFVQNNIGIKLASYKNSVNLMDIAYGMDEFIAAQKKFASLEESGKLPIIKDFSGNYVEQGGKTPLKIKVIDPDNEDFIYIFEPESGSVNNGNGWYYRAGDILGSQVITLHVINEKNVLSTSKINIEVRTEG